MDQESLQGAQTDLSEARLSCSAVCAGPQGGVQAPNPDMTSCVRYYDMPLLGITAHAVDAVQPIHCCSDGAQQCRAGAHLPHPHAAIACVMSWLAFDMLMMDSAMHEHLGWTSLSLKDHSMPSMYLTYALEQENSLLLMPLVLPATDIWPASI